MLSADLKSMKRICTYVSLMSPWCALCTYQPNRQAHLYCMNITKVTSIGKVHHARIKSSVTEQSNLCYSAAGSLVLLNTNQNASS